MPPSHPLSFFGICIALKWLHLFIHHLRLTISFISPQTIPRHYFPFSDIHNPSLPSFFHQPQSTSAFLSTPTTIQHCLLFRVIHNPQYPSFPPNIHNGPLLSSSRYPQFNISILSPPSPGFLTNHTPPTIQVGGFGRR